MAKVKIEPGKTMKSAKALAVQLLDKKGTKKQIKALTKKIKAKNGLYKGQDLEEGMILSVGKKKTKKFGTLVDPSTTNKYSWYTPPLMGAYPSSPDPSLPTLKAPVKVAEPDIIQFDDDLLDADIMADLIFQGIGGHEIINIARNDIINGQQVLYRPIKNIDQLSIDHNSNTILPNEDSVSTFNAFSIRFEDKLPDSGINELGDSLTNLGTGPFGEIVYLEESTGNLIINVANFKDEERVEIETISDIYAFNDTIYNGGVI